MISFKQFMDSFEKKFVCLYFSKETENNLRKYALDNGFNLSVNFDKSTIDPKDFDFHLTVFYTITTHDTVNREIKFNNPFQIYPEKFELLGENHDVPVIKIKVDGHLEIIRTTFEGEGFKDAWPDYKPHISLSYDRKPYNLTNLKLPKFPIIVDRMSIQKQT